MSRRSQHSFITLCLGLVTVLLFALLWAACDDEPTVETELGPGPATDATNDTPGSTDDSSNEISPEDRAGDVPVEHDRSDEDQATDPGDPPSDGNEDPGAVADTQEESREDSVSDGFEDSPVVEPMRADRVLFIGNSYTASNGLASEVANLLAEAELGGTTRAVTPGGYRLEQHGADADGSNGDTQLRQLLVTGEEAILGWDVVVLQQQSQVPGFPRSEPLWIAMLEGATTLRDLATVQGADTVLFSTWGYRDGDPMNPTMYSDYLTMQTRITDGYSELADRLATTGEPVFIAPVGEAFRQVHEHVGESEHQALYRPDGSHPSVRGTYLTACVFFATLTGSSPVGLSSGPSELDAAERLAYQEIAAAVVLGGAAPDRWIRSETASVDLTDD